MADETVPNGAAPQADTSVQPTNVAPEGQQAPQAEIKPDELTTANLTRWSQKNAAKERELAAKEQEVTRLIEEGRRFIADPSFRETVARNNGLTLASQQSQPTHTSPQTNMPGAPAADLSMFESLGLPPAAVQQAFEAIAQRQLAQVTQQYEQQIQFLTQKTAQLENGFANDYADRQVQAARSSLPVQSENLEHMARLLWQTGRAPDIQSAFAIIQDESIQLANAIAARQRTQVQQTAAANLPPSMASGPPPGPKVANLDTREGRLDAFRGFLGDGIAKARANASQGGF